MKAMQFVLNHYRELSSTNEEALRRIAEGRAGEGMVFITHHQLHGKGAGQNHWESEPDKNLTFSLVLEPRFMEPSAQFVITEMVSLALFDVVKQSLGEEHLSIKWPNDLYYKDEKLAGILIQNRVVGNQIDFSVIGVGLNVNQKVFYSDAPNPVSMANISGKEEDLTGLLHDFLEKFSHYYEKIKKDIYALEPAYLSHLYHFDEWHVYKEAAGEFTAKITGIDAYGRLLLTDDNGNRRKYGFKEVAFLPF